MFTLLSRVFSEKTSFRGQLLLLPTQYAFLLLQIHLDFPLETTISLCGLGDNIHMYSPIGWTWPVRDTVTSPEMWPNMGSRARPGTHAGAFRKRKPLSYGIAKLISQFCVCMWRAYLRQVPRQRKAEMRGGQEGEGKGRAEERREMSLATALASLVIQANR